MGWHRLFHFLHLGETERDATPAASPRSRLAVALVLLASALLNLFPLWWGLPAWHGWAYDEILPRDVEAGANRLFSGGWAGYYPALHYYLLSLLYLPFGDSYFARFLAGRLLSVAMATATVYLVYRCARLLGERRASACLAALIAASMPSFVYYAKTVNLEAPYLFWFALSLFFFLRVLRAHRLPDYLAFAVAATAAVCTKDQAYGLYVLAPAVLALALAGERRRVEGRPPSPLRLLADRRLWGSALLALACFALFQNLLFNAEGFAEHLRLITTRSTRFFRLYRHTPADHLAMGWQNVKHLGFLLGWPAFLAALGGLAVVLRRWPERRRWLAVLSFPVSYYVFFISVVLHNYVRFFLPVGLVLALFAGFALERSARRFPRLRIPAAAGVGAILLFGVLRALSVDFAMHADARYLAEEWVAAHLAPGERAVAVGNREMAPRGMEVVPWNRAFYRGESLWRSLDARFAVVHRGDVRDAESERVVERLSGGAYNYRHAVDLRARAALADLGLASPEGMFTNLDKIAREVAVFERQRPWGPPAGEVAELVAKEAEAGEPRRRGRLARLLLDTAVPGTRRWLRGHAATFGLTHDGWSTGAPVALAARNPLDEPLRLTLRLACAAGAADLPVTARVEAGGGRWVGEARFTAPGSLTLDLPPVPPDRERLFLLTTDRLWTPGGGDPRRLGARLLALEWRPEETP